VRGVKTSDTIALGTVCLGALSLFGWTYAAGQDAASTPPKASPNLSNWWLKSSLDYHPMPAQYLAHVDFSVAYSDSQGNTTGSTFNGKVDLSVRKWRLTSRTTGWLQKQNIVYGFNAGSVHVTQDLAREQVNFDLTGRSALLAGIEDYTFTLIFMNDRLTEYGGYGVGVLKTERQKANLVGALGYSEFEFDRARMLGIPSPVIHNAVLALPSTSPTGGGAMVLAAYNLNLPRQLMLNATANYMKFFDSYLGHQGVVNTSLDVPLAKHISFLPGYQLIDQDNRIIDALQVKTQDRILTLGLKLAW